MTEEEEVTVREYVNKLAASRNGKISPEEVVDDARNPESVLHAHFIWDNAEAGERYRLIQARHLITRMVNLPVRVTREDIAAPFYVRDPTLPFDVAGYIDVHVLSQDHVAAVEALRYECRRAIAYMERAREISRDLQLVEDADRILASISGMVAKAERKAPKKRKK